MRIKYEFSYEVAMRSDFKEAHWIVSLDKRHHGQACTMNDDRISFNSFDYRFMYAAQKVDDYLKKDHHLDCPTVANATNTSMNLQTAIKQRHS